MANDSKGQAFVTVAFVTQVVIWLVLCARGLEMATFSYTEPAAALSGDMTAEEKQRTKGKGQQVT